MTVPDGQVVTGTPAKVVRQVTPEEIADLEAAADNYLTLARQHAQGEYPRAF